VSNISPYLGTEVHGVQLSELTKEGLDELALYVAERKVVVFRDQDFKDLGPERQIEIAKYAGFSFPPTNWAYYVLKALRPHPAAPYDWKRQGLSRVPRCLSRCQARPFP
jgi:alpha-ketoglutarate-dependent taurine dioxygenase